MFNSFDQFIAFVNTHGVLCVTVATGFQYILGAAVDSLDEPTPNSSPTYRFVYRFAHTLAANWSRRGSVNGR